MRTKFIIIIGFVMTAGCSGIIAQESGPSARVHRLTSQGTAETIGTVSFRDSQHGLVIEPNLRGLRPGPMGAHVHQNASCAAAADGAPGMGAGTHYDPMSKGVHGGPYGDGHLGDLPNLIVEPDGTARIPVLAPRLSVADLGGRSLMIHANKDNYGDSPGGGRAYCGVIN
jgi:Cu-Zn family superoxide dismutase